MYSPLEFGNGPYFLSFLYRIFKIIAVSYLIPAPGALQLAFKSL